MIVILMGVTGSGKTTVGRLLAERMQWRFAEGDDYHSEANRQKMHAGIPLTDEDRAPWLASLHDVLAGWHRAGESGVLTCSALKESYREMLSEGIPEMKFVWLKGSRELLQQRLAGRGGHFMNPALLASQFATLEVPENAIRIEAAERPQEEVDEIIRRLGV